MKVITGTVLAILFSINIQFIECQSSSENQRCGLNEQYSAGISPCGTLCSNVGKACNIRNIRSTPGCECQKEFARINSTSQCIPVSRCPIIKSRTRRYAGMREIRQVSFSDPRLKSVMDASRSTIPQNEEIPTESIIIENNSELTLDQNEENQRCGLNEQYSAGISPCGTLCENVGKPCNIVTFQATPGCECQKGFARVTSPSPCIPVSRCMIIKSRTRRYAELREIRQVGFSDPRLKSLMADASLSTMPQNEEIQTEPIIIVNNSELTSDQNEGLTQNCSVNSHWDCGNACSDSCGGETMKCTKECINRCICNDGYAMIDGECRPKSECSAKVEEEQSCGVNKIQTNCGNPCSQTCGSLICMTMCTSGCFCKPGYALINDECQPKSKCPK